MIIPVPEEEYSQSGAAQTTSTEETYLLLHKYGMWTSAGVGGQLWIVFQEYDRMGSGPQKLYAIIHFWKLCKVYSKIQLFTNPPKNVPNVSTQNA